MAKPGRLEECNSYFRPPKPSDGLPQTSSLTYIPHRVAADSTDTLHTSSLSMSVLAYLFIKVVPCSYDSLTT